MELTEYDLKRYDRQMRIHGWGEEGQRRIKAAKVGVVGTGGLGSPLTTYLAVAGVGKIIAADRDVVELSNLNRQILHWDKDIGKKKAESAAEKLRQINPSIEVVTVGEEVTAENIDKIFGDVDVIVDGLDNYPSRFLLNEFAVRKRIPFIHGSVWGMEGRVTTILPGKSPCLRCIVPEPPPREVFPVLGTIPALVATIQATEVLKYITRVGLLLTGRLLVYNGEHMTFDEIPIERDPHCPVCSSLWAGE
ncbi:MAG: HesA/MoeB/ThiF family protein [Candidatus Micrarchaeia archaeon]